MAEKLSLGLARIEGPPDSFRGENLRSPTLEARGGGPAGKKASFPPKWMRADGLELQLVFSGEDRFSVRMATFRLAPPERR